MEIKLYIGNLSRSTTQDELTALFSQAGVVTAVNIFKDRKSGISNGFAFITMSAQSEAEKAVSMFHNFCLSDHNLKVNLTQRRAEPRFGTIY